MPCSRFQTFPPGLGVAIEPFFWSLYRLVYGFPS